MTGITLSAAIRSALGSIQEITKLTDRTTLRLATGKKINSIADDAVSYFRAKSLSTQSQELLSTRQNISQGISAINASLEAIDGVDNLLKQLKGITESSKTANTLSERRSNTSAFNEVVAQINSLVNDSTYQGSNLLTDGSLDIQFSNNPNSRFTINGLNALTQNLFSGIDISNRNVNLFSQSGIGGGFSSLGISNSLNGKIDSLTKTIDSAISANRGFGKRLGNSASVLTTRLDYTTRFANRLQQGADELLNADLNEEATNLLALQTRLQLAINALSVAAKQQSAILQLFR